MLRAELRKLFKLPQFATLRLVEYRIVQITTLQHDIALRLTVREGLRHDPLIAFLLATAAINLRVIAKVPNHRLAVPSYDARNPQIYLLVDTSEIAALRRAPEHSQQPNRRVFFTSRAHSCKRQIPGINVLSGSLRADVARRIPSQPFVRI